MTPPATTRRSYHAPFLDRREAGRFLATELRAMELDDPIVIALPRGGVPVAREIADRLRAPLEIFGVRKLAQPDMPEVGFGAITEDGTRLVDPESARLLGLRNGDLDRIAAREEAELRRRVELYRDGRPAPDVRGRTVIVVDDGVATGLTDAAAIRALRRLGARRIVLAVPVCAGAAVDFLQGEADTLVTLRIPERFRGVGDSYLDFSQVSDEEVIDALAGPARTAA
ncbi:MAG TPA: phosphoribosyltransferase family protein [Solirubrobacterales bacterium]|nr:phosphoribosyltransferase family protein [Solirubrobacterales bacterium]